MALSETIHYDALHQYASQCMQECFEIGCRSKNVEGVKFVYERSAFNDQRAMRNLLDTLSGNAQLFPTGEFEAGNKALAEITASIRDVSRAAVVSSPTKGGLFDEQGPIVAEHMRLTGEDNASSMNDSQAPRPAVACLQHTFK
jgi:hypothetical protein